MKTILTLNTILLSSISLFAQEAGKTAGKSSGFETMLPMMLIMFGVIYFMMIKPEQKKAKEKKLMVDELKKNDKIITIGGIHGTVSIVKDDTVQLKIADNTVVRISKSAIASVISDKKEVEEKK